MKASDKLGAIAGAAILAAALASCAPKPEDPVARGRYLVSVTGCSDCHTPGGLTPHPDMTRFLAGSDAEFRMAGMGVYVPPNLTPDKATGLGTWTTEQIVTAFTTGVRPDGRRLSPAMPWADFGKLTRSDALAIAAYLKSLPPVNNKVPGPGAPKPAAAGEMQEIVQRAP
jgi:mono/diheme cytochrome c family protein